MPSNDRELGEMSEALRALTTEMETTRGTVAEMVTGVALLDQRMGQQAKKLDKVDRTCQRHSEALAELTVVCQQGSRAPSRRAVGAAGASGAGVVALAHQIWSRVFGQNGGG